MSLRVIIKFIKNSYIIISKSITGVKFELKKSHIVILKKRHRGSFLNSKRIHIIIMKSVIEG